MLLENYLEQHRSVRKSISEIDDLVRKRKIEETASDIATGISRVAGMLKVHLASEDRYLYPELQKHESHHVKRMAEDYQKEMGGFIHTFTEFKDKYNTRGKLLANSVHFENEYREVAQKLELRIRKEESELYRHIKRKSE